MFALSNKTMKQQFLFTNTNWWWHYRTSMDPSAML